MCTFFVRCYSSKSKFIRLYFCRTIQITFLFERRCRKMVCYTFRFEQQQQKTTNYSHCITSNDYMPVNVGEKRVQLSTEYERKCQYCGDSKFNNPTRHSFITSNAVFGVLLPFFVCVCVPSNQNHYLAVQFALGSRNGGVCLLKPIWVCYDP